MEKKDEEKSEIKEEVKTDAENKAELVDSDDFKNNRDITFLSYVNLLFLFPLFLRKESSFAQFHAKRGLILTIAWYVGFSMVGFFGLGIFICLGVIVISVMGLLQVNDGKRESLPIVDKILEKFEK